MKNRILLCVALIACFGIGFVCGMFAQSRIVDGCDETIIFDENGTSNERVVKCLDGTMPDTNGCCTGEVYTDMDDLGWNCCPENGGDCFPPIPAEN